MKGHRLSHAWDIMWCLVPGAWCLVPGAWCLVPGDYCPELHIDQSSLGLFSRHCIVFLGKEACSHSIFPPRSRNRHQKLSENSTNCRGRKGRGLQRISMGGGGGASEVKEDHVKIFSPVIVHQRDQCDLHPTKQL